MNTASKKRSYKEFINQNESDLESLNLNGLEDQLSCFEGSKRISNKQFKFNEEAKFSKNKGISKKSK